MCTVSIEDVRAYGIDSIKLQYIESYQVVEYLKAEKRNRKSKTYYLSKEVNNIEESRAILKYYIKFTDDRANPKLDILQQEMSNEFTGISELHLEDFIEWLIHHVSIVAELNKIERMLL